MPIIGHKNIKIVVSIALINDADEILISKRPKNKHLAGFWEFPGGKVEKFESNFKALKREIYEELSVNIFKKDTFIFDSYTYEYPEYQVDLRFYICRKWKGTIFPKENQILKWVYPQELRYQKLLPSNKTIVEKLLNHST